MQSLEQSGALPSCSMNLNYVQAQPGANASPETPLADRWGCFKPHPFYKVTLCSLSCFQGPWSQLFYCPISNLVISWDFLNVFLTLYWLLISFPLHLKGTALLYFNQVPLSCFPVLRCPAELWSCPWAILWHWRELMNTRNSNVQGGLPISNHFSIFKNVPHFLSPCGFFFLRWQVLKGTKANMHPETSVFLYLSLQ